MRSAKASAAAPAGVHAAHGLLPVRREVLHPLAGEETRAELVRVAGGRGCVSRIDHTTGGRADGLEGQRLDPADALLQEVLSEPDSID